MKKLKAILADYFSEYEFLAITKGHGRLPFTSDEIADALVEAVAERVLVVIEAATISSINVINTQPSPIHAKADLSAPKAARVPSDKPPKAAKTEAPKVA